MTLETIHTGHIGSIDYFKVNLGIKKGVIFQDLSQKGCFSSFPLRTS